MNGLILLHMPAVWATTIGFIISLIFNYLASMRLVFIHREDMPRWMEMLVFLISSLIGLVINGLIIWIFTAVIISPQTLQLNRDKYLVFSNIGMFVATVVVAIWSFVTRKILLDKPASGKEEDNKIAHALGNWAYKHTPRRWRTSEMSSDNTSSIEDNK